MKLLLHSTKISASRDLIIVALWCLLTFGLSIWVDPFTHFVAWIYRHDNWKLDEVFTFAIALTVAMVVYSWRRWSELQREIRERDRIELRNRELNTNLESAITEVQTLRGILRICESCKRIRDSSGYWISLKMYVESVSDARFFEGLCPDCARKLYGAKTGTGGV